MAAQAEEPLDQRLTAGEASGPACCSSAPPQVEAPVAWRLCGRRGHRGAAPSHTLLSGPCCLVVSLLFKNTCCRMQVDIRDDYDEALHGARRAARTPEMPGARSPAAAGRQRARDAALPSLAGARPEPGRPAELAGEPARARASGPAHVCGAFHNARASPVHCKARGAGGHVDVCRRGAARGRDYQAFAERARRKRTGLRGRSRRGCGPLRAPGGP